MSFIMRFYKIEYNHHKIKDHKLPIIKKSRYQFSSLLV